MNAIEEIRRSTTAMSQYDLAIKTGIELTHFNLIEAGFAEPSRDQLKRIASVLDVPVTYFQILDDPSDDPIIKQFQDIARKTLGIEPPEDEGTKNVTTG